MKLIEAISDWEDQIGMQDTYGCFVLFDNKLSAIIHKIDDTELKDCIKTFNDLGDEEVYGSTQGSIIKQRFSIDGYLFDLNHQSWFFGGVDIKTLKSFISFMLSFYKAANKGAIIIVDRQTGECALTTNGETYSTVSGIDRFLKTHHQSGGKGGYIYYTYVVDNLKPRDGEGPIVKAFNLYVKIRNWLLTTIGKKFNGLKFYKIARRNQIERITQDGGLMGRFLNDNGDIDNALSILVSVPNASSEQLLMIGTDICNSFHQTSVVIEDLNKNICYFANGKKFSGKNYDERKANASRNLAEFEPFLNKSAEERPNGEPNSDIGTVNEADEEAINELLRLAGC